ncbi:hypothetical protein DRO97_02695 [Archaeoglobales archaeon]|nr:MAG: hypothetical protein DRO97_02695 [Archaeoglobales archaeon]
MSDKAVSEIIGEMLLLAIVVILAAVLSANVSNLMPSFEDVPYATFVGKDNGNFTITHEGGDPIPLNELRIVIDNGSVMSCTFNKSNLYFQDVLVGRLMGNGNNYWEFGESLITYKSVVGDNVMITIAHEKLVLCKLYFG